MYSSVGTFTEMGYLTPSMRSDLVPISKPHIMNPMAHGVEGNSKLVTSTFPGLPTTPNAGFRYYNLTYSPNNNCFYAFPSNTSGLVLKINATTNQVSSISGVVGTNNNTYSGQIMASNGRIYSIPSSANVIFELNPENDTLTSFGSLGNTGTKCSGAVVANNGKIYMAPRNFGSFIVVDPFTRTTYTLLSGIPTNRIGGMILAPNGKIYSFPYSATDSIIVINPQNDSTYRINNIPSLTGMPSNGSNMTALLALNNKIYWFPYTNNKLIVELNPENDSMRPIYVKGNLTIGGTINPYTKGDSILAVCAMAALGTNGKIYCSNAFITNTTDRRYAALREFDPETERMNIIYESLSSNFSYGTKDTDLWVFGGGSIDKFGNMFRSPMGCSNFMRVSGFPQPTPDMYTFPSLSQLSTSLYNKFMNKGI